MMYVVGGVHAEDSFTDLGYDGLLAGGSVSEPVSKDCLYKERGLRFTFPETALHHDSPGSIVEGDCNPIKRSCEGILGALIFTAQGQGGGHRSTSYLVTLGDNYGSR